MGWRISIHAPRVGCDTTCLRVKMQQARFQSTHPVWGATRCIVMHNLIIDDFNPRTPCGVRPKRQQRKVLYWDYFNPRTPCGVRPNAQVVTGAKAVFQSTHPVWGAT